MREALSSNKSSMGAEAPAPSVPRVMDLARFGPAVEGLKSKLALERFVKRELCRPSARAAVS